MAEENFKERVRLEIMKAAKQYEEIYVGYEYLICSEAFMQNDYYMVSAMRDNFQHLTGVHSNISSREFFDKCIQGTLIDTDFDFIKKGQDEKAVKGTVRRKIKVLPNMMELFKDGLQAEENFKKNKLFTMAYCILFLNTCRVSLSHNFWNSIFYSFFAFFMAENKRK